MIFAKRILDEPRMHSDLDIHIFYIGHLKYSSNLDKLDFDRFEFVIKIFILSAINFILRGNSWEIIKFRLLN